MCLQSHEYATLLPALHTRASWALVETLPSDEEVSAFGRTDEMKELVDATISDSHTRTLQLHLKAKQLLDNGRVMDAWKVLLM